MKLRAIVALLAAMALLVGASGQPERNTENLRDARKIRYGQRQELANDAASGDVGDPSAPLSLLPAGAAPAEVADLPNSPPKPGGLQDGVTATVALDGEPDDSSGTVGSVRSLAIDGAPFGEVRRKVEQKPQAPPSQQQAIAQAAQLPTLRGSQTGGGKPVGSLAKPVATKPVAAPSELAKTVPMPAQSATTKPVTTQETKAVQTVASAKPVAKPTPQAQTAKAEVKADDSADEFKWLAELESVPATDLSTDAVRHGSTDFVEAEDETALTDNPDFIAGSLDIDEATLGPLGIPGETVARAAPGRLAKTLLGAAGILALVLIAVVVPRPKRRRSEDGLSLIETIGMDDERELVILRKKHYALVLGVTRTATHLLEKVSMASLDSDYSSVINSIIKRESEYPELWRMRPLFSAGWRVECAPEVRAAPSRTTSLGEMRASLQVVGAERVSTATPAVRASMSDMRQRSVATPPVSRTSPVANNRDAVIRKLREQARRAS